MRKIIVWGLGREYRHYCNILHSRELLQENGANREEYKIIAYCDEKKMENKKYVTPDEVFALKPDIIITSKFLKGEIESAVQKRGNILVKSFEEFIQERFLVHPRAIDRGMGIDTYLRIINERTTIDVKNFFEIGANYGQDSEYCRLVCGLQPSCIYTFEASPIIADSISNRYQFNNYNIAVSNYDGIAKLHVVSEKECNSGLSTIADYDYAKEYEKVDVKCMRMDSFLKKHPEIGFINFLQIDAEGVGYEVLEGFGECLNMVQSIQIEAEHIVGYCGQHLFWDIATLLEQNDFELMRYGMHSGCKQSDSLWVKREFIKRT